MSLFSVRPSIKASKQRIIKASKQRIINFHELGHLILAAASETFKPSQISCTSLDGGVGLRRLRVVVPSSPYIRDNENILISLVGHVGSIRALKSRPLPWDRRNLNFGLSGITSDLVDAENSITNLHNTYEKSAQIHKIRVRSLRMLIGADKGSFSSQFKKKQTAWENILLARKSIPSSNPPHVLRPISAFKHAWPGKRSKSLSPNALKNAQTLLSFDRYTETARRLLANVPDSTLEQMHLELVRRKGNIRGENTIQRFINEHIPTETMQTIATEMLSFSREPVEKYYGVRTLFPQYLKPYKEKPKFDIVS
jgi:hypothetical protein